MFKFQTEGEVTAILSGRENQTYIRIKPYEGFMFRRQGEIPGLLGIELPASVDVRGMGLGSPVRVSGSGAVGVVDWEKREFGKVKTKQIDNFYFRAEKFEIIKKV
jgi:hypothetical protein